MNRILLLCLWLCLPSLYAQNITVGTTSDYPPFSSLADKKNHFFGFDVDIMSEVCKRIKQNCLFKPFTFNQLFTQIKSGGIDLAIAAITITTELQQSFLFSYPYLESNAQFMTLADSAIKTPGDINHKKIGVRQGTAFKTLAINLYKDQVTILEYPEISDLLDNLANKNVDIILVNALAAKSWEANNDNVYKLIGTDIPIGKGYGIMANTGKEPLIQQINQALLDIESDGTYLKIFNRYFAP